MTNKEAIDILSNVYYINGRGCGKMAFQNALIVAINAINTVDNCICLSKEEYEELCEYKYMYEDLCK